MNKERVSLMVQLQFLCHWLLTGGTAIPVCLIAVVPTILEKSVFYKYLVFPFGLLIHCCLVTTRAFMPASVTVVP